MIFNNICYPIKWIPDPGNPLNEEGFFFASQLTIKNPNATTEMMMKILADGEIKGSEHGMENPSKSRSGLEPIM